MTWITSPQTVPEPRPHPMTPLQIFESYAQHGNMSLGPVTFDDEKTWTPDLYMKFWRDFGVFPSLLSMAELSRVGAFLCFMHVSPCCCCSVYRMRDEQDLCFLHVCGSCVQTWKLANAGVQSDSNPFDLSFEEFGEAVARVALAGLLHLSAVDIFSPHDFAL